MQSAQRLLVFAPHPDDESLGCAGLIQQVLAQGGQVRVVFATDGDANPWPQRYLERRWRLGDGARARWGARRRTEARAALRTLGVSTPDAACFLGWPDQGLTALRHTQGEVCIARLRDEILAWQPTWLAGPVSWDEHPDHASLARMLDAALAQIDRPIRVFGYLIHGQRKPGGLGALTLTPSQQACKAAAILCHRSQMALSRRRFLRYAGTLEPYASTLVEPSPHRTSPSAAGSDLPTSAASANVVAIVCCYDVAPWCGAVIQGLLPCVDHVVAVNDGSTDDTRAILEAARQAEPGRITVLGFAHNHGKGAALIAGLTCALEMRQAQIIVTVDGDGQHACADVPALVQAVREGADLAIGLRDFSRMPPRSRLGNVLSSRLMQKLYPGSPCVDTQCGLRAFSAPLARRLIEQIRPGRYETELQMLQLSLAEGWRVQSVPIQTLYLDGNRSSHFRPLLDSWRILRVFSESRRQLKKARAS